MLALDLTGIMCQDAGALTMADMLWSGRACDVASWALLLPWTRAEEEAAGSCAHGSMPHQQTVPT